MGAVDICRASVAGDAPHEAQTRGKGGEGLFLDRSLYRLPGAKKCLHRPLLGPFCRLCPVPGERIEAALNRGFDLCPQEGRTQGIHFPALAPVIADKPLKARIGGFGVGSKAEERSRPYILLRESEPRERQRTPVPLQAQEDLPRSYGARRVPIAI